MARYTGPRSKVARRFNDAIFGPCKELKKKAYPPGQHGRSRRRKPSDYSVQLLAKQKAKHTYGVLEKQFRKMFKKSAQQQGITGVNLLILLESRLDNVVYRLNIGSTRAAARQLVGHKHITVNGNVVNIPSFSVKPGDIVGVREKSKTLAAIGDSLNGRNNNRHSWLEWDSEQMAGKFLNYPSRDEIPENLEEQLIVELYSK